MDEYEELKKKFLQDDQFLGDLAKALAKKRPPAHVVYEAWGLSTRTHNVLMARAINPEDVLEMNKNDLMNIHWVGEKIAAEIIAKRKLLPY